METTERNSKRIIEIVMSQTGMRQKDIAQASGVSEGTISRILADDGYSPNYKTHLKLKAVAQKVLKTYDKQPATKPKEGNMDYDDEINELKTRVSKLERHLLDLMADMRPFRSAPTDKAGND